MTGRGWFWRWAVWTYAVHLVAQVAFISTILWLFGLASRAEEWLAAHRGLVAFTLVIHFTMYLLTALTSADRERLDKLEESLDDE